MYTSAEFTIQSLRFVPGTQRVSERETNAWEPGEGHESPMSTDTRLDTAYQDPVLDRFGFEGKDVLEVGSGFGDFTLAHLVGVGSLFCVEKSSKAIDHLRAEWAKRSNSPVEFCQGDITTVPLPAVSFDLAVFSDSF